MHLIFDDKKSWWHAFLGVISGLVPFFGILILTIYIFYQIREKEDFIAKLGDFIEFLVGWVYGVMVWMLFAR